MHSLSIDELYALKNLLEKVRHNSTHEASITTIIDDIDDEVDYKLTHE